MRHSINSEKLEDQTLQQLYIRYIEHKCTPEEIKWLYSHFGTPSEDKLLVLVMKTFEQDTKIEDTADQIVLDRVYNRLEKNLAFAKDKKVITRRFGVPAYAAAAILFLISISAYFLLYHRPAANQYTAGNIKPGTNGATLTLANGEKIVLEQTQVGHVIQQNGTQLQRAGDSLLIYQKQSSGQSNIASYNSLETPQGRQYTVVLPDGSKVWLNAGSTLKYPTFFSGKERLVELSGEGYFEIVHNAKMPFKVKTNDQLVEDIGTHFNIYAYKDEKFVKTTLLEGSISVHVLSGVSSKAGLLLKPGQQAILANDKITMEQVEAEDAISWKNGYFRFNNETLEEVMKKIARWYNVTVEYSDENIKNENVYGSLSRFSNISDVIKLLKLTKAAKFKIDGNKIIVSKTENE